LIERAPSAILLTEGAAHVVRYANPASARLSCQGIDSLLGRPLAEALPPQCGKDASALLDDVYRTGEPRSVEDLGYIDAERGALLWSLVAWPVLEGGEHLAWLLVMVSDGTPRAQAHRRDRELAEETRRVNERLVVAGVRMQELAEEAEAARRRLALLAEVGRLLGEALATSSMLPAIAELLVSELCDHCAIDVARAPDAAFQSVAAPPAERSRTARAAEYMRKRTLELDRALVFPSTPDADSGEPEVAEILRASGFSFVISVPLNRRTGTRGVLTMFARDRRYDPADVTLAYEIADRIALGVDHAELYQKALDAVRARDDLLAAVSHDLRNPLNTIVLTAGLLAPKEAGKSSHVERIRRSAAHMQHLIQDLLDSAKLGAGRFFVDRQPHAVAPVVAEVIEMLTPVSASKSLRIEAEIDDALADLVMWMDRERIVQVLANIIGNSIKFTPEGGAIIVGAERSQDEVRLSIRDTGPGIPREDLSHLFDRFWQARQTARLGTGLGLFIAKEIVEAHGGKVWAESEVGAGSTFFVTLPLSTPAP
jgi:signal transduction histidine kinase